jgi:hypothetical protein
MLDIYTLVIELKDPPQLEKQEIRSLVIEVEENVSSNQFITRLNIEEP